VSPTVGVLIRTLNEAELLGRCLETLASQQGDHELDVLVLDSGSTDDTLSIAREHGARIYEMAPEDFDYSRSLNVGIEGLRGELILILSAHAIPLDGEWVARMTAPFSDPRVAGVASRQVPWPGHPFREVHRLAHTFGEQPRSWSAEQPDGLVFSNAASCVRRSAWEAHPFTLPAAEDLDWAERVIAAGSTIVYEPRASVYHSHDESPRALARRLIDLSRGTNPATASRIRPVREAAGFLVRDGRLIADLDEPIAQKLKHLRGLLETVVFYVVDFSRTESTAVLRRESS
jgi:rhamnosyltransferase